MIYTMASSKILISETNNCHDLFKSVYDPYNIIYLQEKIKNLNEENHISIHHDSSILPVNSSRLIPINHNKFNEWPLDLSLTVEYPYCYDTCVANIWFSASDNKFDQSEKGNLPFNFHYSLCECDLCNYLDKSISDCNSEETSIIFEENILKDDANKSNGINIDNISIEINQEMNPCDFEIVHTISEDFVHETNKNMMLGKISKQKAYLAQECQYICTVCSMKFKKMIKLKCHMLNIHGIDRPFICRFCNQCFKQSSHLVSHVRRHTGEKPFKCFICNKAFIQGTSLKTHIKNMHTNKRKTKKYLAPLKKYVIKNFYCEDCKKTYIGVCKKEHVKTHVKNIYKCLFCSKQSKKLEKYKKHISLTYSILRRNCSKQHAKQYKKTSNKDPVVKHVCKYCNKTFNNKSNLMVHCRIHTHEKRFQCDICLVSFRQISHLKDHYGLHERKYFYFCSICNRKFANHIVSARHVRNNHSSQLTFIVKTLKNQRGMKEDSLVN